MLSEENDAAVKAPIPDRRCFDRGESLIDSGLTATSSSPDAMTSAADHIRVKSASLISHRQGWRQPPAAPARLSAKAFSRIVVAPMAARTTLRFAVLCAGIHRVYVPRLLERPSEALLGLLPGDLCGGAALVPAGQPPHGTSARAQAYGFYHGEAVDLSNKHGHEVGENLLVEDRDIERRTVSAGCLTRSDLPSRLAAKSRRARRPTKSTKESASAQDDDQEEQIASIPRPQKYAADRDRAFLPADQ